MNQDKKAALSALKCLKIFPKVTALKRFKFSECKIQLLIWKTTNAKHIKKNTDDNSEKQV